MERLYAQLKAAEDSGNSSEVERLTKLIEDLENARKQYEETLQEGYDIDEKRLENQIKIWAENFKKITEKLELELKIND
jgi:gamma-glutamyl:cysteine ligase YbdK (ATP-grasp superfamily)